MSYTGLLTVLKKYTQNSISFHHPFSYHPGPTPPHLLPGFLQEPPQWYQCVCSCHPVIHSPCSSKSDPVQVGSHPLLCSKLSNGLHFTPRKSLAFMMSYKALGDTPRYLAHLFSLHFLAYFPSFSRSCVTGLEQRNHSSASNLCICYFLCPAHTSLMC